jgi:integrase/recombinase XerD
MRQAQTLNEAQLRRVLHYCRSRRHPTRDETIILFSFHGGLRAKELASLKRSDVFDEERNVRE